MPLKGEHPFEKEMAVAEHAAREAGSIIMGMFKGKFDVREKSKNNPVTSADLAANNKIREIVHGAFPADGWLSEEDDDTARRLTLSRTWIVDPIDGTKEFIEGVSQFAISIGLVVDGKPTVSVVYNPAKERFYQAAAGQGAWLNDQPIRVSARDRSGGALLLVSRSEPKKKFQVFVDCCEIKPVGSIAYRLAKVAAGDGDGTLTFRNIREWDICGGVLLVEEAGGAVIDGTGEKLLFNRSEARFKGMVAANPNLVRGLQGLVAKVLAEQAQRS